jgi:hypothetical protein
MARDFQEREKAAAGYERIKKAAPNHLAMAAFGMQGELPELPNDIESPHLWSHDFLWAYDGLSDIPWDALPAVMTGKPWVVHEYGKFGVWPDPKEAVLYPENGYKADFDRQARLALEEIGLLEREGQIIKNSRRLSYICNRTIIEEARRQETNSGYVIWKFFRCGSHNAGFIDDFGQNPDRDPDDYKYGCNAPAALLIDCGFSRRTLRTRGELRVGAYVSNFGETEIKNAELSWSLEGAGASLCGSAPGVEAPRGVCTKITDIQIELPAAARAARLSLKLSLTENGRVISQNDWDFWMFPEQNERLSSRIAYDFENTGLKLRFKNRFGGSVGLRELDSLVRGCRSWTGTDYERTIEKFMPNLLVCDRFGETAKTCLRHGMTVLLLDDGGLPESWYTEPSGPHLKDEDTARFYTSFRCGWDQGNLATLVAANGLPEDFPCEDFCDLQFYPMIDGARTVRLGEVKKDTGAHRAEVLVRSVAKLRPKLETDTVVQDPNALKELEFRQSRTIFAQDRVFLAELEAGGGKLILCTLRVFDDPAGEYLLAKILERYL